VNIYARQDKTSVGENSNNQNLARIRWATLGYHYDWTNKIYKQDDHTKMPDKLAQLCQTIMQVVSSNTGTKKFEKIRNKLFFRLSDDEG
jgi:plasmid maintenance system killer protein